MGGKEQGMFSCCIQSRLSSHWPDIPLLQWNLNFDSIPGKIFFWIIFVFYFFFFFSRFFFFFSRSSATWWYWEWKQKLPQYLKKNGAGSVSDFLLLGGEWKASRNEGVPGTCYSCASWLNLCFSWDSARAPVFSLCRRSPLLAHRTVYSELPLGEIQVTVLMPTIFIHVSSVNYFIFLRFSPWLWFQLIF